MDNAKGPDVMIAQHDLFHDHPGLVLTDFTAQLEEDTEVVPIAIILHHIDVGASLDGLVKADGVRASDHAMDPHLLMDTIKFFRTHICDFYDLAGVYFL